MGNCFTRTSGSTVIESSSPAPPTSSGGASAPRTEPAPAIPAVRRPRCIIAEPQRDESDGPLSAMEALPEDCLLAVLRLLPTPDLMLARGVCRRWAHAALHPDAWKHRVLASGPRNVEQKKQRHDPLFGEPLPPLHSLAQPSGSVADVPGPAEFLLDMIRSDSARSLRTLNENQILLRKKLAEAKTWADVGGSSSSSSSSSPSSTPPRQSPVRRRRRRTRMALMLAPCAKRVVMQDRLNDLITINASGLARCAAAELVMDVTCRIDEDLAVPFIWNQVSLGRLRSLSVNMKSHISASMLGELVRVQGLHHLRVECRAFDRDCLGNIYLPHIRSRASQHRVTVPAEAVPASLRVLFYCALYPGPKPHLEFLLRSHAATLAEVTLRMDVPYAPSAEVFNALPNLRRLDTSLLKDLHLLDCPLLYHLGLLWACPPRLATDIERLDHEAAVRNTEAFLRSAAGARLTSLGLADWQGQTATSTATALLTALAETGEDHLTTLTLERTDGTLTGMCCGLDVKMLMMRLPSVRKVRLLYSGTEDGQQRETDVVMWPFFWEALALEHVPSLEVVEGSTEVSRFMHGRCFRSALRKNPQLHFLTVSDFRGCREGKLCGTCAIRDLMPAHPADCRCHEALAGSFGKLVGVCCHPAEGDAACGIKEHADASVYSWARVRV